MPETRALIFANGDLGDPAILRTRLQPLHFDIVVAADKETVKKVLLELLYSILEEMKTK